MIQSIIIDSREPAHVKGLKFGGIPVMVSALDAGDVMAACDDGKIILIERKTSDDLLGSMKDNRLVNQAVRMLDTTRWSYLIVTGFLQPSATGTVVTDRGETQWSWASVQGLLITLQELGVFVVHVSETDFEAEVLRIGNRERKEDLLILPAKSPMLCSPGERILTSLPGIGEERVQEIISATGSAAWALSCLTDAATNNLPGIGPGIKNKIRAALGLRDAEQLAIETNARGDEVLVLSPYGSQ